MPQGYVLLPGLFNLHEEYLEASQVVVVVKNPLANAGDIRDAGSILGWKDPLEKG